MLPHGLARRLSRRLTCWGLTRQLPRRLTRRLPRRLTRRLHSSSVHCLIAAHSSAGSLVGLLVGCSLVLPHRGSLVGLLVGCLTAAHSSACSSAHSSAHSQCLGQSNLRSRKHTSSALDAGAIKHPIRGSRLIVPAPGVSPLPRKLHSSGNRFRPETGNLCPSHARGTAIPISVRYALSLRGLTGAQSDGQMDRQIGRDRQTGHHAGRQIGGQIGRHTDSCLVSGLIPCDVSRIASDPIRRV